MRITRTDALTPDEASALLRLLSPHPDEYLANLVLAHQAALSDAQDTLLARGWTRGEVSGFFAAMSDVNVFEHDNMCAELSLIVGSTVRARRAERLVEESDTWCDRCDELAQDHALGRALVTLWRAWRQHPTGIINDWVMNDLPSRSPRFKGILY